MVTVKNVLLAATCAVSALAAPMEATKRQWGGDNSGMGNWGGQDQGQGQDAGNNGGWNQADVDQGQGQSTEGGDDSGNSNGGSEGVPIAGDGQSNGTDASSEGSSSEGVPIAGDGNGGSSGSGNGGSQGNGNPSAVDGETLTTSGTGNSGDYYYSHWVENDSGASMTLGSGQYSLEWTEASGNIVSGIGWNPASARTVTYDAEISASGNWYLALYGWTKSPLIEFYVVEAFGSYDPSSGASALGTAEIDGGTYTLLETTRENQPSIEGTSTFQQYWAVRNDHRTSGSIDFGAHIEAWSGVGLELGSFDYMIMATEGYQSSGSSTVSLS